MAEVNSIVSDPFFGGKKRPNVGGALLRGRAATHDGQPGKQGKQVVGEGGKPSSQVCVDVLEALLKLTQAGWPTQ